MKQPKPFETQALDLDMELVNLAFALLGFNLSLVQSFSTIPHSSHLECILCDIVCWKYVIVFLFILQEVHS